MTNEHGFRFYVRPRKATHEGFRATRILAALLLFATPMQARSTGSEMAGFVLVVPILIGTALFSFTLLAWLFYLSLPRSWSRQKRVIVALVVAPLALGLLVLLASVPGLLQLALVRHLLS
jgi:hypothetical protein